MKPSPLGKVARATQVTDEVSYTAKITEIYVVTQPHPPLPRSPFPKGEGLRLAIAIRQIDPVWFVFL